MAKPTRTLFVFSLTFLLFGCGNQTTQSSSAATSSAATSSIAPSSSDVTSSAPSSSSSGPVVLEGIEFRPKKVNTYLYSKEKTTQMDVYYRVDGMKNIPYVKLRDYYANLLNKELQVSETSSGIFLFTSAAGGTAAIDTKENTFKSPDIEKFINTTIYRQEGAPNVYYDGSHFVRVNSATADKEATETAIAFGADYDINLFALQGDVLLPLDTCSNLFQGPTMLTCTYTTHDIFFVDPNSPFDTMKAIRDEDYVRYRDGFYENGKRSQEQADFAYNELRFFLDHYYGQPGRETLHADLFRYGNIDAALANHDEFTKKARTLLRSTDRAEYYVGLCILQDYLADTGHTVLNIGVGLALQKDQKLLNDFMAVMVEVGFEEGQAAATREGATAAYITPLEATAKSAGVNDLGTLVQGDTAMFTFNEFRYDVQGWDDYYSGKRAELPEDAIGNFKRLLEKYKDGKTVKNVVVNLSDNGGGSGDVVFAFMALMGKQPYLNYYDFLNKNIVHAIYDVDANFDGKFDQADKELNYPYNFAILASGVSFSCGNILPTVAKESGIMLLGDQTGGGACAVLDAFSAEGLYTRSASQVRLQAQDGSAIDFGVAPHEKLVTKTDAGYDFSKMYDLSIIGQKIHEFYAK